MALKLALACGGNDVDIEDQQRCSEDFIALSISKIRKFARDENNLINWYLDRNLDYNKLEEFGKAGNFGTILIYATILDNFGDVSFVAKLINFLKSYSTRIVVLTNDMEKIVNIVHESEHVILIPLNPFSDTQSVDDFNISLVIEAQVVRHTKFELFKKLNLSHSIPYLSIREAGQGLATLSIRAKEFNLCGLDHSWCALASGFDFTESGIFLVLPEPRILASFADRVMNSGKSLYLFYAYNSPSLETFLKLVKQDSGSDNDKLIVISQAGMERNSHLLVNLNIEVLSPTEFVPHANMVTMMNSAKLIYCTGDQSLAETITLAKPFLYENPGHKPFVVTSLLVLAEYLNLNLILELWQSTRDSYPIRDLSLYEVEFQILREFISNNFSLELELTAKLARIYHSCVE